MSIKERSSRCRGDGHQTNLNIKEASPKWYQHTPKSPNKLNSKERCRPVTCANLLFKAWRLVFSEQKTEKTASTPAFVFLWRLGLKLTPSIFIKNRYLWETPVLSPHIKSFTSHLLVPTKFSTLSFAWQRCHLISMCTSSYLMCKHLENFLLTG